MPDAIASWDGYMTLQSLANQHRRAILAQDQTLADQIAAQYRQAFGRFHQRLQKLLQQLQQARQAAEDDDAVFNAQVWLYQFQRLDSLLFAAQQDFDSFSRQAQDMVRQQVHSAFSTGEQDALSLLQSSNAKAVFGVPNPDAIDVLLKRLAAPEQISQLFAKMDRLTLDLIRKRMLLGASLGEGPRQLAADLANALKIPLNRALTIARTESINAYRSAALDTYRANSDVVEGWIWSAAAGACPFCASMDGTLHDLSETLDSHPNCRCGMLPKVVSYDVILSQLAA